MDEHKLFNIGQKNYKRRDDFFYLVHNVVGKLCTETLEEIKETGDALVLAVALKAASDKIMESFIEEVASHSSKEQVDLQFNECLRQYELLLEEIKKHNMSIEAGEGDI